MYSEKKIPDFRKSKACVHNVPIIKLLFYTKISTPLRSGFSRKFPKCGLLYFRYAGNPKLNTK